jgi:Zn ribbon nucleic-acid-binding protein
MKEIHDSKCPLCDSDATFTLWDSDHIKLFTCPQCPDYFISILAERSIPKVFNRKQGLAMMVAQMKGKTDLLEILLIEGDLRVSEVPRTKYLR